MGASLKSSALAIMAEHVREDNYAGDGYTEPREAWVDCSCGAQVWQWQQFYFETSEDREGNWIEHLSAMTAGYYIANHMMSTCANWGTETCALPIVEDDWAEFF